MADRRALALAELVVAAARAAARRMPRGVKQRIEAGIFHAIFQKTRVENDAYGWRPPPPGGAAPESDASPESPTTPRAGSPQER